MKKDKPRADDFLKSRKWKAFLMAIPTGKPKGYPFQNANDLNTIRVRATQLNTDPDCPRKFNVTIDFDDKVATITANDK